MSSQVPPSESAPPRGGLSELRARVQGALDQLLGPVGTAQHAESPEGDSGSKRPIERAQDLLSTLLKAALAAESTQDLKSALSTEEGSPLHVASRLLSDTSQTFQRALQRYLQEVHPQGEGPVQINGSFLLEHGAHLLRTAASALGSSASQVMETIHNLSQQASTHSSQAVEFDLASLLRTLLVRTPTHSAEPSKGSKLGGAR